MSSEGKMEEPIEKVATAFYSKDTEQKLQQHQQRKANKSKEEKENDLGEAKEENQQMDKDAVKERAMDQDEKPIVRDR